MTQEEFDAIAPSPTLIMGKTQRVQARLIGVVAGEETEDGPVFTVRTRHSVASLIALRSQIDELLANIEGTPAVDKIGAVLNAQDAEDLKPAITANTDEEWYEALDALRAAGKPSLLSRITFGLVGK